METVDLIVALYDRGWKADLYDGIERETNREAGQTIIPFFKFLQQFDDKREDRIVLAG